MLKFNTVCVYGPAGVAVLDYDTLCACQKMEPFKLQPKLNIYKFATRFSAEFGVG